MHTVLPSLKTRKTSEERSLAVYMHVAYLVLIVFSASSQRGSNSLWPIEKPAARRERKRSPFKVGIAGVGTGPRKTMDSARS